MEIYYCKKCRSRVSSYDVTAGKGMMTDDGETYCQSCIKELGLDDLVKKEAQKPKKKHSTTATKIRTTGVHRSVRQTGKHRPVRHTTSIRRPVNGHLPPSQAEIAAQKKSNAGIVLGIIGGIILAVIIAAVVVNSGEKQPQKTKTSGSSPIKVGTGEINQSSVVSDQSGVKTEDPKPENTPSGNQFKRPAVDVPAIKDEGKIPEAPERIFTSANGWNAYTEDDWKEYVFSLSETLISEGKALKTSVNGERMNFSFQTKKTWLDHSVAAVFAVSRRSAVRLTFRTRKDGSGGFLFMQDVAPGVWHTIRANIKGEKVDKLTFNGKDMKTVRAAGVLMRTERLGSRGKTGMTFTTRTNGTTDIVVHEFAVKGTEAGEIQKVNLAGLWKFKKGDNSEYKSPAFDDSEWGTQNAPQDDWDDTSYDGIAWYRRKVFIPEEAQGGTFTLHFGAIDDSDTTYVNGVKVGEGSGWRTPRTYPVSGSIITPGEWNLIAVRVLDGRVNGGIRTAPVELAILYPAGAELSEQARAQDVKANSKIKEPGESNQSSVISDQSKPGTATETTPKPGAPKLLSHWSFDGDSESIFRDAGENDQSGVFYGAQKAAGRTGKGVEFDGKSMRAELTRPIDLPSSGTIAFWVKKNTDFKNTGAAVYGGKTFAFLINKDNNIGVYVFPEGTSGLIKSKTAIIPGVWTHIALTYDSSAKKRQLYINGKLDTENAGAMTPPEPMKLIFGSNGPSNKLPFGGGIDEVFLYEGILDANQVVACMLGKSSENRGLKTENRNKIGAETGEPFTGTDVIWIEGENPTTKENWRKHPWYHDKDMLPGARSEDNWLSHFEPKQVEVPQAAYEFTTANAEYRIMVRKTGGNKKGEYQIDDGEWQSLQGKDVKNTRSQSTTKIDVRFLGWALLHTGTLSAGKHTVRFRFPETGPKGAAIDCLCITTDKAWKPDKTHSKPQTVRGPADPLE